MLGARDRSLAGHKSSLLFDQVCNCACNCTTILQLADGHGGDAGREEAARGGGREIRETTSAKKFGANMMKMMMLISMARRSNKPHAFARCTTFHVPKTRTAVTYHQSPTTIPQPCHTQTQATDLLLLSDQSHGSLPAAIG